MFYNSQALPPAFTRPEVVEMLILEKKQHIMKIININLYLERRNLMDSVLLPFLLPSSQYPLKYYFYKCTPIHLQIY